MLVYKRRQEGLRIGLCACLSRCGGDFKIENPQRVIKTIRHHSAPPPTNLPMALDTHMQSHLVTHTLNLHMVLHSIHRSGKCLSALRDAKIVIVSTYFLLSALFLFSNTFCLSVGFSWSMSASCCICDP